MSDVVVDVFVVFVVCEEEVDDVVEVVDDVVEVVDDVVDPFLH